MKAIAAIVAIASVAQGQAAATINVVVAADGSAGCEAGDVCREDGDGTRSPMKAKRAGSSSVASTS